MFKEEISYYKQEIMEMEFCISHLREIVKTLETNMASGVDLDTPFSQLENFPAMSKIRLIEKHFFFEDLTICDYLYLLDDEILKVPGVGKKSLKKIENWLLDKGIQKVAW